MRLLNTSTLQFRNFNTKSCPPYAILSHRWGTEDDEPTYQDYRKSRKQETSGHQKIVDFCTQALWLGLGWGWIDTVCIDKRSSAELSEAINSMFAWYKRSACCLTFLDDVDTVSSDKSTNVQRSAWFTRGWTLQELLAPSTVLFYDRNWELIGSICDSNLKETYTTELRKALQTHPALTDILSDTTGIPQTYLVLASSIKQASIAQRMSWASKRVTTVEEDGAYSLLGLFGVNMPLLYGEGGVRAFERLQREIIELSNDESIFSWAMPDDHTRLTPSWDWTLVGPLARHPRSFQNSASVRRCNIRQSLTQPPFRMTNRGLELNRPSWQMGSDDTWAFNAFPGLRELEAVGKNARLIKLACTDRQCQRYDSIDCYIFVVQDGAIKDTNQWFRVMPAGGRTLAVDESVLRRKTLLENQLFYIGSFAELDEDGPSVDWSVRRWEEAHFAPRRHAREPPVMSGVDKIPPVGESSIVEDAPLATWTPDDDLDDPEHQISAIDRASTWIPDEELDGLARQRPGTKPYNDERSRELPHDFWAPPASGLMKEKQIDSES